MVDNNPRYAEDCKASLKEFGFDSIVANSIEEGQTLFGGHKSSLVAIIVACSLGSNPPFDPFPFAQYVRAEGFTGAVIGTTNCRSHANKMARHPLFTDACYRGPEAGLIRYYLKNPST